MGHASPEAMTDAQEITSKDGTKLFVRTWLPAGTARAVVVIVHGLKAHSGLYEWPASEMAKAGFAVYALDLRGHGKSGGERLYAAKMIDYVDDVRAAVELAKTRHSQPIFMLAHSAGGVIACAYALQSQNELAGLICESFALEVPASRVTLSILKGIARIAPHLGVFKLKDEDFSRDHAFVEQMKADPLISRSGYPAQTIAELARVDEQLHTDLAKITIPVLVLHGTEDHVTLPSGSKLFGEISRSPDKTVTLYQGHFHDLLNDVGKERVLGDMMSWLGAHA
jgi:alpha-beta hydrolase superfamily lysophospholipase